MIEEFSDASLYFHILPRDLRGELITILSNNVKFDIITKMINESNKIRYFVSYVHDVKYNYSEGGYVLANLDNFRVQRLIQRFGYKEDIRYCIRIIDISSQYHTDFCWVSYMEGVCIVEKVQSIIDRCKSNM
jgi:hypothetical protein